MRETLDRKKTDEIEETFHQLVEEWRSETAPLSSIRRKKEHPAYRKIVEMGEPAVPLILADLARKPSHLFWVLPEITKTNPVDRDVAQNLLDVINSWIAWSREQGYEV
jgi:hypothetical protein